MRHARVLAMLGIGVGCLTACGGTAEPPKSPETPTEPASEPVDATALCDAVEKSSDIPISCTVKAVGDQPVMILTVSSEEVLRSHIDGMVKHLVAPFCSDENDAGEASGVIFAVGSRARHLDCATATLSDWVDLSQGEQQTVTIQQACQVISQSDADLACDVMDLQGIPALVIAFDSHNRAEASMGELIAAMAGSFCQSAVRANVRAALVLLKDSSMAKTYDCSTDTYSAWFSVRKQPKQRSAPQSGLATATPVPSGSGGRMPPKGNAGWELIRL